MMIAARAGAPPVRGKGDYSHPRMFAAPLRTFFLPELSGKRTALHFAMHSMSEAVVATLLTRGADPNVRDDGDNAMPIHFAAERGALNIVKRLIEHGADPIGAGTTHELEVIGWATC